MKNPAETRWFSLSGRELLVLLLALGGALAVVGAVKGVGFIWGRGEVTVTQSRDTLVLPVRVNINTATRYELTMLPQIGPVTAEAIIEHRERSGPFKTMEDMIQVRGIGPKTIESIRPHAMCAPVPEAPNQTED